MLYFGILSIPVPGIKTTPICRRDESDCLRPPPKTIAKGHRDHGQQRTPKGKYLRIVIRTFHRKHNNIAGSLPWVRYVPLLRSWVNIFLFDGFARICFPCIFFPRCYFAIISQHKRARGLGEAGSKCQVKLKLIAFHCASAKINPPECLRRKNGRQNKSGHSGKLYVEKNFLQLLY